MEPVRHSITIATAGHVDHGKTSLVRSITGTDTDTLAEEKSRGLTINLGFAYHHFHKHDSNNTEELTLGFVDVPGHIDFINNALAGIAAADFALLVVAADDGVMPQTREHLAIIDLLGIDTGAIVITKIDKVAAERIDSVMHEIQNLVTDTVFANAPVFQVSAQTKSGLPPLIEYLEKTAAEITSIPVPTWRHPRFAIDRCFSVKGIGTVVTGTVMAGILGMQNSLVHSGSGTAVRVKGLRHDQQDVACAVQGERVAINVSLTLQQVARGDWLLGEPIYHPAQRIDVRLRLFQPWQFKSGVSYHFYHGTSHQLVQIRQLNEDGLFQISSTDPIFACNGDRFILRDPACEHTLGGGKVIDVFVPRRGRSSAERLAFLEAMTKQDYPAVRELLQLSPGGVDLQKFAASRNCDQQRITELLDRLQDDEIAFTRLTIGQDSRPVILHQNFLQQAERRVLQGLKEYHQAQPGQAGIGEPALSSLVDFENSHLLFHAIVEHLISKNRVTRTGTLLHLPEHKAQLSEEEINFLKQIRPLLLKAGFVPPRTRELEELTGIKLGSLERILARARKSGNLVQVAANRHYLPETIVELAEFTESLARGKDEGFTVIEFRDRVNIGRNLCIEILEYFDRIGFTVRDGNNRILRTTRENLFGATKPSSTDSPI